MRITLNDLRPDLPASQKWAMLYHHFREGGVVGEDVLSAIAEQFHKCQKAEKNILKFEAEPTGQLEADVSTFKRYCQNRNLRQFLKKDDSPNISAVCRAIGVEPGGAGWRRGVAVVEELKRRFYSRSSSTSTVNRRPHIADLAA